MLITQSTITVVPFLMVANAGAVDPDVPLVTRKTGLTPTVTIRKAGGSFTTATNAAAEIGNGWYEVSLTATETNTVGTLIIRANSTGATEFTEYHQVTAGLPVAGLSSVTTTDINQTVADKIAAATLTISSTDARAAATAHAIDVEEIDLLTAVAALVGNVSMSVAGGTRTIKDTDDTTLITITLSTGTGLASPVVAQTVATA